jgi:hypothetical protein
MKLDKDVPLIESIDKLIEKMNSEKDALKLDYIKQKRAISSLKG